MEDETERSRPPSFSAKRKPLSDRKFSASLPTAPRFRNWKPQVKTKFNNALNPLSGTLLCICMLYMCLLVSLWLEFILLYFWVLLSSSYWPCARTTSGLCIVHFIYYLWNDCEMFIYQFQVALIFVSRPVLSSVMVCLPVVDTVLQV